jgi:phage-related protein
MEFWRTGGENMADFQVTQLFQDVADAYTRMAERTEDVTGASESQVKSNDKMTEAADSLKTAAVNLPRWLGRALEGMTVQMDGENVARVIVPYVDNELAANLY